MICFAYAYPTTVLTKAIQPASVNNLQSRILENENKGDPKIHSTIHFFRLMFIFNASISFPFDIIKGFFFSCSLLLLKGSSVLPFNCELNGSRYQIEINIWKYLRLLLFVAITLAIASVQWCFYMSHSKCSMTI